jgi:hypothetical protein
MSTRTGLGLFQAPCTAAALGAFASRRGVTKAVAGCFTVDFWIT